MATWAKTTSGGTDGQGGYVNLDLATHLFVASPDGVNWEIGVAMVSGASTLAGTWSTPAAALAALDQLVQLEGGVVDPSTL